MQKKKSKLAGSVGFYYMVIGSIGIACLVLIASYAVNESYSGGGADAAVEEAAACAEASDCPVINCTAPPCQVNVCEEGACVLAETEESKNVIENTKEETKSEDVYPQVWSQNSPAGESYEFKVNCGGGYDKLEECFLWGVDRVSVTDPAGRTFELEKDFNVNSYSGETTRRFVLYGEPDTKLPVTGDYIFDYYVDEEVVYTQTVGYVQSKVSYPTGVAWVRSGSDLQVSWSPPAGVTEDMWYKAIVWNAEGTPELFISKEISWDADSSTLEDVPFVEGGSYVLNMAVFFPDGYAYSEYVGVEWKK